MVLAVGGHDHEQCEVRQQKSAPLLQWTISSERADNFPKELTTFPKTWVRYVDILICYEWQWARHHLEKGSYTSTR
jgi:hypothetical protein